MTRWPPRPRPAPTASWPEENRSFIWGGGTPLAGAQRGSPSPSPTPSPNARYSGRWRLRMSNGLPSLTVPRHTTKTTIKKLGPQAAYGAKNGWSYGLEHAFARPEKYLLENASCPTAGKKRRLRQEYGKIQRAQLIALPGQLPAFPRPYSGYTASDANILSKDLPASISPYIGGPAAKAARRITRYCQKTTRAFFGGWGSLRGKGPFFRQNKGPSPSNQSLRSPDSP